MAMVKHVDVPMETVSYVDDISMDFEFEAICPVPGLPYSGTIQVSYEPKAFGLSHPMVRLLEWNSLQEYLKSIRGERLLAEQMAQHVLRKVEDATGAEDICVILTVESAFHLPVTVVASI